MGLATRMELAKHYLSLDAIGQEKQKELAKYVPEYLEEKAKSPEKPLTEKEKSFMDKLKNKLMGK